MIISIASGKGGTGKTTVATNLAVSVASDVQLLDCDVEEPNAHLFINPVIEAEKTVYTPVPQIDEEKCTFCKKCAENCPSGSLESGNKEQIRGVFKWQSNMETCYQHWVKLGTDCAICMAVCPYSKPSSFYHSIVRFFSGRNAIARRLAFYMDDVFYTKNPRHTQKPGWFSKEQ